MATIKDIITQFELDINLPEPVLKLHSDGNYDKYSVQNEVMSFKTNTGEISMKPFECYVFEGADDLLIICPTNTFQMVSICKQYKGMTVGTAYGHNGSISSKY